eukprot:2124779-Rhodomonas_salina.1
MKEGGLSELNHSSSSRCVQPMPLLLVWCPAVEMSIPMAQSECCGVPQRAQPRCTLEGSRAGCPPSRLCLSWGEADVVELFQPETNYILYDNAGSDLHLLRLANQSYTFNG